LIQACETLHDPADIGLGKQIFDPDFTMGGTTGKPWHGLDVGDKRFSADAPF
jgi:hypothetical protein